MKSIRSLAIASSAAALLFASTARADGDVPPDPVKCPALYADACVVPGICSAECVTYCDGIDSTDATLECKGCLVTLALDDFHACQLATIPPPPDCATDYGYGPCAEDYADPPACSETVTVSCVSDGDMVCAPGQVSDMCCKPAASYPSWLCVTDTSGAGGAGGSP